MSTTCWRRPTGPHRHLTRDDVTGCGRPATPAGPGRRAPRERAHGRPVPAPHRPESPRGLVTVTGANSPPIAAWPRTPSTWSSAAWGRRPARAKRSPPGDSHPGRFRPAGAATPGARPSGLDQDSFTALVARHGNETPAVLAWRPTDPISSNPGGRASPPAVEAVWRPQEMAMTVDDVCPAVPGPPCAGPRRPPPPPRLSPTSWLPSGAAISGTAARAAPTPPRSTGTCRAGLTLGVRGAGPTWRRGARDEPLREIVPT